MIDALLAAQRSARARFFPVRHYSPAAARMLLEYADTLDLREVLIEGPSDFNDRRAELSLDHTLPLAIFSYARFDDNSRASAFHPFCEYSPEWQAIQLAGEREIPWRFIDLPWTDLSRRYFQKSACKIVTIKPQKGFLIGQFRSSRQDLHTTPKCC